MSILAWLVCLAFGHVRTEWAPVVDVQDTYSWLPPETYLTTNASGEVRFCLRCEMGLERRTALGA